MVGKGKQTGVGCERVDGGEEGFWKDRGSGEETGRRGAVGYGYSSKEEKEEGRESVTAALNTVWA